MKGVQPLNVIRLHEAPNFTNVKWLMPGNTILFRIVFVIRRRVFDDENSASICKVNFVTDGTEYRHGNAAFEDASEAIRSWIDQNEEHDHGPKVAVWSP